MSTEHSHSNWMVSYLAPLQTHTHTQHTHTHWVKSTSFFKNCITCPFHVSLLKLQPPPLSSLSIYRDPTVFGVASPSPAGGGGPVRAELPTTSLPHPVPLQEVEEEEEGEVGTTPQRSGRLSTRNHSFAGASQVKETSQTTLTCAVQENYLVH